MISKRLSVYGFISAAAVVSGVLVGCGGSSASTAGINPTVTATGGVAVQSGSSTQTVGVSSSPQQVQVTLADGTTPTVTVPPGETVTPGVPFNVLPANLPFIQGLSIPPSQKKGDTTVIRPVYVDGFLSGVAVNADGSLNGFVLLTIGTHTITTTGPFNLGSGANTLTIGAFSFKVVVDSNGNGSIPSAINMRIPANGGSTANGNFVTVQYPTPAFSSGTGKLILSWPGVTKVQTKTVVNGRLTFKDPLSDSSDTIPSTGVSTIEYDYSSQ